MTTSVKSVLGTSLLAYEAPPTTDVGDIYVVGVGNMKWDGAAYASVLGTAASADSADFATAAQGAKADGSIQSVVEGAGINVDNTDPANPIISTTAAGFVGEVITPQLYNRSNIPAGLIPADGQELPTATYPDLFTWVQSGAVKVIAETDWWADPLNRAGYVIASSAGKFRVPDLNGAQAGSIAMFARGATSDAQVGHAHQDQFQNIAGEFAFNNTGALANQNTGMSGPFKQGTANRVGAPSFVTAPGGTGIVLDTSIDPSLRTGTETYPSHFQGIWCIRAFGTVANPGAVDAAQLASDLASLDARVQGLLDKTIIGSCQFVRATNEILMHGIVTTLGLEIGDVIQITGSASNNFTMTVEVITDANDINVNYAHRNGAGPLSLTNETVACTVKRIAKRYSAPINLGRAPLDVTSIRIPGTNYRNTTGREMFITCPNVNTAAVNTAGLSKDGVTFMYLGQTGGPESCIVSFVIPDNWYYRVGQIRTGALTFEWR